MDPAEMRYLEDDTTATMKTIKGATTGLVAGTIYGTVVATWHDVPRVERNVSLPGLIRTMRLMGNYGLTFGAIGGVYIGVEQIMEKYRMKRDFVNGAVGAFVAGATILGYKVFTMSSSDGHGSQDNGSGNEERLVRSDDPRWLHGYPVNNDNDRQKTECKYCGKRMEGITRLKQHLVGGYSNVSKCKLCPTLIRDQMRELLKGTKSNKSDRAKRDESFKRILFDEEEREPVMVLESDEDTVYPPDCQT